MPTNRFCPGCRRPTERCICDDPSEPRASRMPEHMASLDPAFLHALDTVPEDAAREKEEGK